jgi:hypothetical protein
MALMSEEEANKQLLERVYGKYDFVEAPEKDEFWIKLQNCKYEGLVYRYGRMQLAEKENDDGTLPMRFEYDIISVPEELEDMEFPEEEKVDFENLLGDILVHILDNEFKENQLEPEPEIGDDNTENFDEE